MKCQLGKISVVFVTLNLKKGHFRLMNGMISNIYISRFEIKGRRGVTLWHRGVFQWREVKNSITAELVQDQAAGVTWKPKDSDKLWVGVFKVKDWFQYIKSQGTAACDTDVHAKGDLWHPLSGAHPHYVVSLESKASEPISLKIWHQFSSLCG